MNYQQNPYAGNYNGPSSSQGQSSQGAGPSNWVPPGPQNYNGPSTSQGQSSQGAGPSNWDPQGWQSPDFNPHDRNYNYRPPMGQSQQSSNNRGILKMTPYQFKKKLSKTFNKKFNNVNINKTASLPVTKNPRNKGFLVKYKRLGEEPLKVTLNKISDDLQISLKTLKGFGFRKGERSQDMNIIMIFNEEEPYTKVSQKMDLQENTILEGKSLDIFPFVYEGPRELTSPLSCGDIFASVRMCETVFPLKLSKSGSERNMAEAIDLLQEWRDTRFSSHANFLENAIHSIRVGFQNLVISFVNELLRTSFKDLLSRNLCQFEVSEDVHPTVVAISQGQTPRGRRNMLKVTPDMAKLFQMMSNVTPQMLEFFKVMSSGKFAIVPTDDDTAIDSTTERLNQVSFDNQMDTDYICEVPPNLPAPLNPTKTTAKEKGNKKK